jgi:hypothetical protein
MPEENDALESAEATEGVEAAGEEPTPDPLREVKTFLEERGLKSPDDFSDYVSGLETAETWKKKYGSSQNEVGELRRELESIRNQVTQYNQDGYSEQPVNLPQMIEEAVSRSFNSYQQGQIEQARKYAAERGQLMREPGWKDVQPYFDQALQNPEVTIAIQNGSMTQEKLYNRINERVLLSKVQSAINTIPQAAVQQQVPATAETSDRVAQPLPEDEARKKRRRLWTLKLC